MFCSKMRVVKDLYKSSTIYIVFFHSKSFHTKGERFLRTYTNNRTIMLFSSQVQNKRNICTCLSSSTSNFKSRTINNILKSDTLMNNVHINKRAYNLSQNKFSNDDSVKHEDQWIEKAAEKTIQLTTREQRALLKAKPHQPLNPYILKIAIFGLPNAGKSTLANQLIGWRYSGVSNKVHTTRHKSVGVFTKGNTQLVFLDTPGVITPHKKVKHRLEDALLVDPHSALCEADIIVVLVDVSSKWQRKMLDQEVLKVLHLHKNKKKILVLNKCDLYRDIKELMHITKVLSNGVISGKNDWYKIQEDKHKKKDINLKKLFDKVHSLKETAPTDAPLHDNEIKNEENGANSNIEDVDLEDNLQWRIYYNKLRSVEKTMPREHGYSGFDRVFHTSALDNVGVEDVKDYLIEAAKPGDWQYNESVVTDMNPIEIAKMCVRDKLMDYLPKELPYIAVINLTLWEVDEDGLLRSQFEIILPKRKHLFRSLLYQKQIVTIAEEAKQELMNTFRREMTLHLVIKWDSKLPKGKKSKKK